MSKPPSTLRPRSRAGALLVVTLGLLSPRAALADGPLGANGEPITTSAYSVDFTRGPVLSSSRATGLAGAYTAIAEGAEGGLSNPASVANRYSASADWWDYWLAFGITYPVANGDFFNSGGYLEEAGELPDTSILFFNPGLYVQLDRLGFGLDVDIQRAQATTKDEEGIVRFMNLRLVTNHVQVGWLFWDGQLALAAGMMIVSQWVSGGVQDGSSGVGDAILGGAGFSDALGKSLGSDTGLGAELGVLLRPTGQSWRIGAGIYSKVRTGLGKQTDGDRIVEGYYLPQDGQRPWQGNVAFAYQLGGRPLNPSFTYVEKIAADDLAAIDAKEEAEEAAHAEKLAKLRGVPGPELAGALVAAEKEHRELMAMYAAERAAIKKIAWRSFRERVRTGWHRNYVLLTAELSISGRTPNSVGVESFLLQTVQRSGEHITATPRIAAESEVWPNWIKVRGGLYLEPTRFEAGAPRLHGTLGMDFRLLSWDVFRVWPEDYLWQLSLAGDATRDYVSVSFGIGGWY